MANLRRYFFMGLLGLWCLLHLRKQLSTVQHFLRCNPHARPPGESGAPTAVCGRVSAGMEFNVNRQPSKWSLTAARGRRFKGVAFRVLYPPSK